ncbi:MAG: prepilin-type N-terminal cleavage/methylation domain-containing protein [Candidatus Aminicenantes bacterium]|nr:prepilin-type N-terminal cleavage/methylation domain-containing protein [Candidatus Aminicenantes bacterium]
MNTRPHKQNGFSLVEMMVSLTVMLIIIVAIFSIIVAEQATHLTEGRKLDMNQGARVIEQMLSEGFRSAGSVLSLANTPVLLGSTTLPFNGIYPLNNSNYPDGVILASGDPQALTRLTNTFTAADTTIDIQTVNLPDSSDVAWHEDDFGMVMRTNGYYVFRVTTTPSLNDIQLAIRGTSAYYSGLLSTANYIDASPSGLGTYLPDSPVVRLDYFNIFLTRTETDGSRTLTLSVDCEDQPDVLAIPSDTRAMPILPNIEDIQIEYVAKLVPPAVLPDVWAGSDAAFPGSGVNFYNQFFTKNIASARIYVLLRTEEERNKSAGSGITYAKPAMGDRAAATLPVGRYHYTYMQYQVFIRNYNL